jgi:dimethylaniline monooxygenase (N-oxide forming)
VLANGEILKIPKVAGADVYKGKTIHSQSFKHPNDFHGKSVVVLGIGNNTADISTALVGHASKIYLAHRRGANIVSLFCQSVVPFIITCLLAASFHVGWKTW